MSRVAVWGCDVASVVFVGRAQACSSDAFSTMWGNATEIGLRVKEIENCQFGMKVGHASHLESMVVAQAPQHGTLVQIDRSHFAYHPSSKDTGPDVMRITATGDSMGRTTTSGQSNLMDDITVQP